MAWLPPEESPQTTNALPSGPTATSVPSTAAGEPTVTSARAAPAAVPAATVTRSATRATCLMSRPYVRSDPRASLDGVIPRYTRPEIGAVWTDQARMDAWRRVELAACEEMEGPTPADLDAIRAATFTVEAAREREKVTDHDVAAFVDVLSESAGDAGRWIHFGLTSSDVLDTALALQLRDAGAIILRGAHELVAALASRAREHVDTIMVGRTHGIQAEPTTFGVKLAGFAFEAHRNADRSEEH